MQRPDALRPNESVTASLFCRLAHEVVPECEGVIPHDEEGNVLVVIRDCNQRAGCGES